jgi:hypothetical protein
MYAFWRCFELHKALVGPGLAPQVRRTLQEPPVLGLAICLDHLLDPRALFCRQDRFNTFHSISLSSDVSCALFPIAQPGSVGEAILDRSAFPKRRDRAAAPESP